MLIIIRLLFYIDGVKLYIITKNNTTITATILKFIIT